MMKMQSLFGVYIAICVFNMGREGQSVRVKPLNFNNERLYARSERAKNKREEEYNM